MGSSAVCCCSASEQHVDIQKLYLAELDVFKLSTVPVEHI